MSTINDGGSAFPIEGNFPREKGMSLRDYFAVKADVSIYNVLSTLRDNLGRTPTIDELAMCVARVRFIEADAMLKARSESQS